MGRNQLRQDTCLHVHVVVVELQIDPPVQTVLVIELRDNLVYLPLPPLGAIEHGADWGERQAKVVEEAGEHGHARLVEGILAVAEEATEFTLDVALSHGSEKIKRTK